MSEVREAPTREAATRARAPLKHVALRKDNAFLAALLAAPDHPADTEPSAVSRAAHGQVGYRYIVLQLDAFRVRVQQLGLLEAAVRARLRELRRGYDRLLGTLVYEDARLESTK